MKWQCFMKCHSAWKKFYENRKADIASKCVVALVQDEKIVQDTLRYKKSNIFYKTLYEVKYFVPMHMGFMIRVLKKIQKMSYQKI